MSHLILVLLIISLQNICNAEILDKLEGEVAKMDFLYPCESTEVTLQRSNGRPFYSSVNPENISLPSRYQLRNHTNIKSDLCFLKLTINPVSRIDEGTFILTAYKDGQMLPEYPRIGLLVRYPPDKASCESSDAYIEGEWIRLYCYASVGNLPGQIICYQNGKRLPPLTSPEENGGTLNQIILARSEGLVYCCSSTKQNITDMCECKDTGWDPFKQNRLINIPEPCSSTVQAYTQESPETTMHVEFNSTSCPCKLGCDLCASKYTHWKLIPIILFLIISFGISICFIAYRELKYRKLKNKNLSKYSEHLASIGYAAIDSGPEIDPLMGISIGKIEVTVC